MNMPCERHNRAPVRYVLLMLLTALGFGCSGGTSGIGNDAEEMNRQPNQWEIFDVAGVEEAAVNAAHKLDFFEEAVLRDYVKDPQGNYHDLMIMVKPADQIEGVPGGINTSLQDSQSSRLHVQARCRQRPDGLKVINENLFRPIGSEFRLSTILSNLMYPSHRAALPALLASQVQSASLFL